MIEVTSIIFSNADPVTEEVEVPIKVQRQSKRFLTKLYALF